MYLTTSKLVVGAVLLKLGPDGSHLPVYYVSKAILLTEQNYTLLEKVASTLRMSSKKLRPYFQAHQINVLIDVPLRAILHRLELSRRLIKWVVELSEFSLWYLPYLSLKGQVLTVFIAEWPNPVDFFDRKEVKWWILYVDGVSHDTGKGIGLVLQSPTRECFD